MPISPITQFVISLFILNLSIFRHPIYRIPMAGTPCDRHVCFLMFHSLSTPMRGINILMEISSINYKIVGQSLQMINMIHDLLHLLLQFSLHKQGMIVWLFSEQTGRIQRESSIISYVLYGMEYPLFLLLLISLCTSFNWNMKAAEIIVVFFSFYGRTRAETFLIL